MAPRYFTEDEARAYLPRLRRLLSVVRRSADVGARAGTNGHAGHNGHGPAGGDEPPLDLDPQQAVAEIEAEGIVLRDPQRGLVDFPARHPGGRTVLLCWQLGEDDLAWWHFPEDGFAGRRPLPWPPEI
jgi:uncharacterized protein DUF2203